MCKLIFYISIPCLSFMFGCKQGDSTEKYQKSRDNVVNVKQQIKEIPIDENDVLISGSGRAYAVGDYLMILDFKSTDKLISVFDRHNYRYIAHVVDYGQGPCEISNPGDITPDEEHGKFYISDFSKMKIFSFDVDSLLHDTLGYKPTVKASLKMKKFPTDYVYVNDTLCVGRSIVPTSSSDYVPSVSKWNMQTGAITSLAEYAPQVEKKRVTCTASAEYRLAMEAHSRYDLITIVDFDGHIKCNIYGPHWTDQAQAKRKHYFGDGVFCKGDKFIVSYSGNDYEGNSYNPSQLMVFKTNGDYVKTLDLGYPIIQFTYDEANNRLIFSFNDEIQFGYLDLDGLI